MGVSEPWARSGLQGVGCCLYTVFNSGSKGNPYTAIVNMQHQVSAALYFTPCNLLVFLVSVIAPKSLPHSGFHCRHLCGAT